MVENLDRIVYYHYALFLTPSRKNRKIAKPPTHSRVATNLSYPIPCASVRVPFNILELTTPLIVAVSREQAADKTHRWSVKFHARGLLPFLSSSSFARQPSPRTFHTEPETRADTRKREKEMDSGVEREEGAFVAHAHGFPLLVDIGAPSPSPPLPRPSPPPPVRPSPPPRSQRRTAPPTTPPTVSRLSPLPPRRSPPRPSPPVRVPRFYPHSTPPALPRPVRVAVTPPFARRVLRHGHSLSPLASCLSSHVSISYPLPPLFLADPYARSFFFFSSFFLPCLSSAFLRLFFHLFSLRVSYRFSPIFHSLRPTLLYTFTDPVSIRPSSSRFHSLRFASLSLFLSFFPSSFLFYVYVRIYFIYMYIHIYV